MKKLLLRLSVLAAISITAVILLAAALYERENVPEEAVFMPAIMYHSVCEKAPADYIVTPRQFEQDMIWLKENGFESVTEQQLIGYTHGKCSLPEKPVLITLDHGFYNNYSEVLPLLEKYDFKAVVNNVGSFTEKYTDLEEQNHPDCHNPDYCYLTLSEITKMSESGRVEMGCHTYDMHSLGKRKGCGRIKNESPEAYETSLTEDIEKYRRIMPYSTSIFAYPYGIYSKETPSILRKLGFTAVFDCTERMNYIDDKNIDWLFNIHRYNRPSGISSESFFAKIQ